MPGRADSHDVSMLRTLRRTPRDAVRWLRMLPFRVRYLAGGIESIAARLQSTPGRRIPPLLRQFAATVGAGTNFKRGLRIDNASGDANSTGDFSNLVIG